MTNQTPSPWRERLTSPLTWHYAGFAVLLVVSIGLAVRLGLDWAATNGRSADALAGASEVAGKSWISFNGSGDDGHR